MVLMMTFVMYLVMRLLITIGVLSNSLLVSEDYPVRVSADNIRVYSNKNILFNVFFMFLGDDACANASAMFRFQEESDLNKEPKEERPDDDDDNNGGDSPSGTDAKDKVCPFVNMLSAPTIILYKYSY